MDGVNDSAEQANGLASISAELGSHVNVIPMNPTPLAEQQRPSPERVQEFVDRLRRAGARVTLRDTRGEDIQAACGQLRARNQMD